MIDIVKNEFRRRLIEEGLSRIEKCLSYFTEDEIWERDNENTNSIGNIVLHLTGNVRQYIQAGVGLQKDSRQRDSEFDIENKHSKEVILEKLKNVLVESSNTISQLSISDLTQTRKVQGFDETVLSIIIHVIEHFSYHVGQITFYTKSKKNIDTAYYAGLDLNITD